MWGNSRHFPPWVDKDLYKASCQMFQQPVRHTKSIWISVKSFKDMTVVLSLPQRCLFILKFRSCLPAYIYKKEKKSSSVLSTPLCLLSGYFMTTCFSPGIWDVIFISLLTQVESRSIFFVYASSLLQFNRWMTKVVRKKRSLVWFVFIGK